MLSITYSRLVKLWASFGGVCQARAVVQGMGDA